MMATATLVLANLERTGTPAENARFWPARTVVAFSQNTGASHVKMRYDAHEIEGSGITKAVSGDVNWLPQVTPAGRDRWEATSATVLATAQKKNRVARIMIM